MIQGHAQSQDYPRLDELAAFRDQYGYDPLRWLWTRSVDGQATGEGDSPELATAYSIIAGISDRWELAGWYWAETRTRSRDHVLEHVRRRDIAIVDGDRRFSGSAEYAWERGSAVPEVDQQLVEAQSEGADEPSVEPQTEPRRQTMSSLGNCPRCGHAVTEEHVAGEIGYWCGDCSDFVARTRDELDGGVQGGEATA